MDVSFWRDAQTRVPERPGGSRNLEALLCSFVAAHRGLRFGVMFGAPAAYAGGRLFAYAVADGIVARLPPEAVKAAFAKGATNWAPGRRRRRGSPPQPGAGWVMFRPKGPGAADSFGPFLEIAARHVVVDQCPGCAPRGSACRGRLSETPKTRS